VNFSSHALNKFFSVNHASSSLVSYALEQTQGIGSLCSLKTLIQHYSQLPHSG